MNFNFIVYSKIEMYRPKQFCKIKCGCPMPKNSQNHNNYIISQR